MWNHHCSKLQEVCYHVLIFFLAAAQIPNKLLNGGCTFWEISYEVFFDKIKFFINIHIKV